MTDHSTPDGGLLREKVKAVRELVCEDLLRWAAASSTEEISRVLRLAGAPTTPPPDGATEREAADQSLDTHDLGYCPTCGHLAWHRREVFAARTQPQPGALTVTTAAIRLPNGLIVTMPRPHRHGSLLNRTHREYGESRDHGFMLSDGSYADRAQAYEVAEAAGQIIKHWPGLDQRRLFSEHLWVEEAALTPRSAGDAETGEGVVTIETPTRPSDAAQAHEGEGGHG